MRPCVSGRDRIFREDDEAGDPNSKGLVEGTIYKKPSSLFSSEHQGFPIGFPFMEFMDQPQHHGYQSHVVLVFPLVLPLVSGDAFVGFANDRFQKSPSSACTAKSCRRPHSPSIL